MQNQAQPQTFVQLVDNLIASAKVNYADRSDADNIIDNISARSRQAVYGNFGDNLLLEQYNELMAKCGQYEAYLPLLAAKHKNAIDSLEESNIQLSVIAKTEATRLTIKAYIEAHYQEFLCESKTILASELLVAIEEVINSTDDIITSEIFKFCRKKVITIKW